MQLAQVNVARLREPMDHPLIRDFAEALAPVNALAEAAPGYVWRLQDEAGNATAIRVFDDDLMIVNMSVWDSLDALSDFVFRTDHSGYMRRRREWFQKMEEAYAALWWVTDGHEPSPQEARDRLEHLRVHGPTAYAFTFRAAFPPEEEGGVQAPTGRRTFER